MAMPPSSAAEKPARAPDSLPIGVRAPATITDPGMGRLLGKSGVGPPILTVPVALQSYGADRGGPRGYSRQRPGRGDPVVRGDPRRPAGAPRDHRPRRR